MDVKYFLKTNKKIIICTFLVCIVSIFINISLIENLSASNTKLNKNVYSREELAKYNGVNYEKLYLAVMGSIFDVTIGKKHYAKGSSYNYFIGKDGTRALVSGNFKDESAEKDHILDLKCVDIFSIIHWRKTFRDRYTYVGILEGRYFNSDGSETQYMKDFKTKLKKCKEEKENAKKEDLLYPPCNVAWSEGEGTRVWCSKSSGGVTRDWVGVPRQLYKPGEEKPKCVCVKQQDSSMLKEYEGCSSTATECFIHVS